MGNSSDISDCHLTATLSERIAEGRCDMSANDDRLHLQHSGNSSENQAYVGLTFACFLESRAHSDACDDMEKWAIASFSGAGNEMEASESCLGLWIATMIHKGFSRQTRKRYFNKLSALYGQFPGADDAGKAAFSRMRRAAEADEKCPAGNFAPVLDTIKKMQRSSNRCDAATSLSLNVFFYLFYNSGLRVDDAVAAVFDSALTPVAQLEEIVEGMKAPRRKYVFPLLQGRATDRQIRRNLSASLAALLKRFGLPASTDIDDAILSLWIASAFAVGMTLTEVRTVIPRVPAGFAYLRLVQPLAVAPWWRNKMLARVADAVNDLTPRWYVMKMRPRIVPDDIFARLENVAPALSEALETFYPCDRIVKMRAGKKVVESSPVISSVLFFRLRPDRVSSLFRVIGDQAWCYRDSNRPDSPYSVIPAFQMRMFQLCIGQLTDDISLELTETAPDLSIGREVEITGGRFAGYRGRICDILNADSTPSSKRIFTLELSSNSAFRWSADIPEEFIREV